MTQTTSRCAWHLFLGGLVTLVLALLTVHHVIGQAPDCPAGFVWNANSGVGCVQEDCFDVGNSRLSYTGSCICNEGYKGCFEPVDTTNVACGPFCPASRLVACVGPEALCPGQAPFAAPESPASSGEEAPEPVDAGEPAGPVAPEPDLPAGTTAEKPPSVPGLIHDLEDFLAGQGISGPSPEGAAAGNAALTALIGAWVLINAAAGVDIGDLLRAVQDWRGKSRIAGPAPAASSKPAPTQPASTAPSTSTTPMSKPAITPPSLSRAGVMPPQGPTPPPPGPTTGTVPGQPVAARSQVGGTGAEEAKAPPTADPAKVQELERRFRQMVARKLSEGYYVRNTDVVRKAWNQTLGRISDLVSGHTGGQCDEFSAWGVEWTKGFVREIFGDGAIVDEVYISERSSRVWDDAGDWVDDHVYDANHVATRVILPTGESYILDYWDAVGNQQMKMGTDAAYDMIFDEPAPRAGVRLMTESEWIQKWKPAIGVDDAEVHNLNYAQAELRSWIRACETEEQGIQMWRNMKLRGVQDHQMETIINNYKKTHVWWELQ